MSRGEARRRHLPEDGEAVFKSFTRKFEFGPQDTLLAPIISSAALDSQPLKDRCADAVFVTGIGLLDADSLNPAGFRAITSDGLHSVQQPVFGQNRATVCHDGRYETDLIRVGRQLCGLQILW